MKLISVAVAALATCIAAPCFGQTACATFRIPGNQNKVTYNPLGGPAATTFNVQVDGASRGVAKVRFILVDQDSSAQGGQALGQYGPAQYAIGVTSNLDRGFAYGSEQPTALNTALAVIPGNNSNGRDNVAFQLLIPAGQQTRAGIHVQDLIVRYECLDASGNPIGVPQEQATPLTVQATVESYVSASIGGRARGLVDFGTVGPSSNLSREVDVTTLSTAPYEVLVDSENGGVLSRGTGLPSAIRYSMSYGDVAILDGQRIVCPRPASIAGRLDRFAVTLNRDDVAGVPAGRYSDTVTLTFSPRDVPEVSSNCSLR